MEDNKILVKKWHQPSIWAFVLSLVGLFIGVHLFSFVAIFVAGLSLSAFGKFKSEDLPKGKGLAIAGLIMGILGALIDFMDYINNTSY